MFVDTHCHLNLMTEQPYKFINQPLSSSHLEVIKQLVLRANAAGVAHLVNVGTSILESWQSLTIAHAFDCVYATIGIHPTDCASYEGTLKEAHTQMLKMLEQDKPHKKIVGVGEIGLDFYHKPYDVDRQKDFLRMQLEFALEHNLPIVFHVREAGDEFLRFIEEYVKHSFKAVIHCFQQDQSFANQVIEWGFYVGCDAPITYPKNASLAEVFKKIPLASIVLETDAPFLPPQHLRGKQNTPETIPLIAQALAALQGIDSETVAHVTTANAHKLFCFKDAE